jgi:hypothetical protein
LIQKRLLNEVVAFHYVSIGPPTSRLLNHRWHTIEEPGGRGGGGGAIIFGQNLKGHTILGFTFIEFLMTSFSKIMTLNLDLHLVDQCCLGALTRVRGSVSKILEFKLPG